MTVHLGRLAGAAACLALVVSAATAASAQSYPTRQITLVVPFAPGGPADFLGRLIGQKMSEDLGQQIVVSGELAATLDGVVSLGRHQLRGLATPHELFAPV